MAASSFMVACSSNGGEKQESMDPLTQEEKEAIAEEESPVYVPEGANVFFVNLHDGDEVTSPVHVEMGVEGFQVVPAGKVEKGTGHHHLIIDEGASEKGVVVPADDTHIHFGGGQVDTEVELTPGEHKLTLQFANGVHQSYGPEMSKTITVTVK